MFNNRLGKQRQCKTTSSILGDLSMRVMEGEPDGDIISAVPAIYGSTNAHRDEKKEII